MLISSLLWACHSFLVASHVLKLGLSLADRPWRRDLLKLTGWGSSFYSHPEGVYLSRQRLWYTLGSVKYCWTSVSLSFSLAVDIGPVVGFVHRATKYCECRTRGWIHIRKLGGLLWSWLRTCLISWCAIFVCDRGFPVLKGSGRPLIREHFSNSSAFRRITPGLMSLMNYFSCLKNLCQRYYQKWLNYDVVEVCL